MVGETRKHLQHIVGEFERACDSMGLRINVGKSKALKIKKNQLFAWRQDLHRVGLNREGLHEVKELTYPG